MYQWNAAFIYALVAIVFTSIAVVLCNRTTAWQTARYFVLMCGSIVVWSCIVLYMELSGASPFALSLYPVRNFFICISTTLLLLHTRNQLDKPDLPLSLYTPLVVIPVFLLTIALIDHKTKMIYSDLSVIKEGTDFFIQETRMPVYWINTAYCILLLLICVGTLLVNHKKLRNYQRPFVLPLTVGTAFCTMANIASVYASSMIIIDYTLLTFAITWLFCMWAYIQMSGSGLPIWVGEALQNPASQIILLDAENKITGCNDQAKDMFRKFGISPIRRSFSEVRQEILQEFCGRCSEHDQSIYSLTIHGEEWHFKSIRREVQIRENEPASFIEIQDITPIYNIMKNLENAAYKDPLTGLMNRVSFQDFYETHNRQEHMPLAFIVGDIDNLKIVNDRFGHREGDKYICLIADILKDCVKEKGIVVRMGGDEFLLMLPCICEEEIMEILSKVSESCKSYDDFIMDYPSISLGYALKHKIEDSLDEVLHKADSDMYRNKRKLRLSTYSQLR